MTKARMMYFIENRKKLCQDRLDAYDNRFKIYPEDKKDPYLSGLYDGYIGQLRWLNNFSQ